MTGYENVLINMYNGLIDTKRGYTVLMFETKLKTDLIRVSFKTNN